jgi:hypothetical protein
MFQYTINRAENSVKQRHFVYTIAKFWVTFFCQANDYEELKRELLYMQVNADVRTHNSIGCLEPRRQPLSIEDYWQCAINTAVFFLISCSNQEILTN